MRFRRRKPQPPETAPAGQRTAPVTDAKPAGAESSERGAGPAKPEAPDTPGQRLEALRAQVAALERKLAIRSFAGGAVLVLALAAGIVGVVLALSAKDESATKDEVRALRDEVEAVQQEAAQAAEEDIASLTETIDALEGRVNTIASDQRTSESELSVVQDDIKDLRSQISGLENTGPGPASGGGANP